MGGISIWQLLIILAIIVLLFGTKKLKNMGSDLGSAVKGFKKAVGDEEEGPRKSINDSKTTHDKDRVIDGTAEKVNDDPKHH